MMNDFDPACAGRNRLPRNGVFLRRRKAVTASMSYVAAPRLLSFFAAR